MAVADFSRINSNIGALNALNSLNNVNKNLGMHQTRLATGRRINSAADDPAGMTIATTFRQRNENLKVALGNIGDAKNLMSVAEAGLGKVSDILLEMRNKAEAAASDTLGDSERGAIQNQLAEYTKEINDIVGQTTWNGKKLLNGLGDFSNTITFQTGAEAGETTTLTGTDFSGVDAASLGIGATTAGSTIATSASGLGTGGTAASFTVASTVAAAAVTATNTELLSGNYTVRVTLGATGGTGSTVQLLDASGNAVNFDNTGSGIVKSAVTGLDLSAATSVSFGNGLTFTWNADDLASAGAQMTNSTGGTFSFTVDYSRSGTYNGDVSSASGSENAMRSLDTAIDTVSSRLQTLGALGSRLSFKEEALGEAQVNTEAAFNRIMNADMAMSQLEATKFQILQQTATSMLAQANQAPQALMSLFR
ncbi:hypothetical protein GC175_02750 [bacterium]|nr:hypothetical protein [bacterium]